MDIVTMLRNYAKRPGNDAITKALMMTAADLLSSRPISCKDCGYVEKDTSLMQCGLLFGHPVVDERFYCARWISKEFMEQ